MMLIPFAVAASTKLLLYNGLDKRRGAISPLSFS